MMISWTNPRLRPLRSILGIALILTLLALLYTAIGCPALTVQQAFRRAEKANLLSKSTIVDKNEAWYYDQLIVGETERGITFFGAERSGTASGEMSYKLTYREKTGEITVAAPAYGYQLFDMGAQEQQPVYLFTEYSQAVTAEITLFIQGSCENIHNFTTGERLSLELAETFTATATIADQGYFYFCFQAEDIHGSAALKILSRDASGGSYLHFLDAEATITATVRLYDSNRELIAEKTMDI